MRSRAIPAVSGLGAFLWDFVVGDDWVGAVGVAALLAIGATLTHLTDVRAWWLFPLGVALVLALTLRRAVRAASAARAARARAPHP
jgi:hypothetical protein